jgi:hypothetical protein
VRTLLLSALVAAIPAWAQEPTDPPPGPDTSDPGKKVTLQRSDVMEVILQHKDELSACVVKQRKEAPDQRGKLLMRWRVKPSGETFDVKVASTELAKSTIAQCMTEAIGRFRFPKHQVQGEAITFPFKF